MTPEEFLNKFQNVLQTDSAISAETALADLSEWDSLAMITTVAFLDKEFGIVTNFAEVQNMQTVKDIMTKAGL
ncbi:MAG: acyl carrier protein [Proteobacteria bacterium]|nr:acyl carrier protein [Pseudomonadota bacterium]